MTERSDGDLVKAAQQGDASAAGELFARFWRDSGFGITGDVASAGDVAAEPFHQ